MWSIEMDILSSNTFTFGGNLGSSYGRICNCSSGVEAEHMWPVWNRQEQRAAERPLTSGAVCEGIALLSFQHTYNECLLCAWHFLGHEVSDEQDEQRLCHTETHVLGENPGEETSEFSCLLCHVFQTSAHAISSGRPSPITHSTIATHLPSFSISLIYFSL